MSDIALQSTNAKPIWTAQREYEIRDLIADLDNAIEALEYLRLDVEDNDLAERRVDRVQATVEAVARFLHDLNISEIEMQVMNAIREATMT